MAPLMVGVSGVRGVVGPDFHPGTVAAWSAALAEILPAGPIVVGRDSRPSGAAFGTVASWIFRACGRDVFDLGIVPTPTVQIAVRALEASGGLVLSASHNPGAWNACKFVGAEGTFLNADEFGRLRERADSARGDFQPFERWGASADRGREALDLHRRRISEVLSRTGDAPRRARILLDCIHGAGGRLLPDLLRGLGADVDVLHEEPHGRFPRNPEPAGTALLELEEVARARAADFALAIDPDADRCAVAVTGTEAVGEEWTLPLVAAHLMQRRQGVVVTNLSTSTRLEAAVDPRGGRVARTPVGEAHVVARMRAEAAVLGGEGNGGVIDPEVHLGRDAGVAAAWLLDAHCSTPGGLAALAATLPSRYVAKGQVRVGPRRDEESLARSLVPRLGEPDDRSDGLRWGRRGGFVHVRFSGTEPILRVIVEGETAEVARAELESLMAAIEPQREG